MKIFEDDGQLIAPVKIGNVPGLEIRTLLESRGFDRNLKLRIKMPVIFDERLKN